MNLFSEVFYENWCSCKLHKIHRKTPEPESLFQLSSKPEACNFIKKELWHRCWWWHSITAPPPDVILPPLRPCMGGNPQPGYDLRLIPHCLPVCCPWLLSFKALPRSQAYDLCNTSFLRLLNTITSCAFSIWGTKLSFDLQRCIFRVHIKVLVV